jgi:membrane protease subunit HflK
LKELQALLTRSLREAVNAQGWGIAVDSVTLVGLPPVEVKAAFLDVSNARAEKDRLLNQEQSRAERLLAASHATVGQTLDRAQAERLSRVESARGSADRFVRLVDEFQSEAESGGQSAADVRRATMQRLFASALDELLPKLSRKVLLDPTRPVDLTIFPQSDERPKNSGPRAPEK